MGIKETTGFNLGKWEKQAEQRYLNTVFAALSYLGEECVGHARREDTGGNYKDDTGNLRGSVGYVVAIRGKIAHMSSFEQVKNGVDGPPAGRSLAEELASQADKNAAVLIVVAGMKYAIYVERLDNYNVLGNTMLYAKERMPKLLKELGL
jgi:hypothetical protein